jgi:hypothetical protein
MLTVYTLKGTLSIGEIKRLLDGAYSTEGFDGEALQALYDRHLEIKDTNKEYAIRELDGIIERNGLDLANDVDYISTVCAIVALSAQLRNIAQAMIDDRFPAPLTPEEEKDKEKELEKLEKEREKERKEEKKAEERRREEEKKAEERRREEEKKAEKERKKEEKNKK